MLRLYVVVEKALLFKMATIKLLPHFELCPDGAEFENRAEESICEAALRAGIRIEHACEMSNACTTCHIYVREGFDTMEESDEIEDDLLDKAWGLDPDSRLSCQAILSEEDIVIEIPKYTINQVSENH